MISDHLFWATAEVVETERGGRTNEEVVWRNKFSGF